MLGKGAAEGGDEQPIADASPAAGPVFIVSLRVRLRFYIRPAVSDWAVTRCTVHVPDVSPFHGDLLISDQR
jgi:hypothetical protein